MTSAGLTRELIALRVARELRDGMTVNLGIGLPTLVANFLPEGVSVMLHAENGILGYGGISSEESEFDQDLINAGGQPVTLNPGASFFSSAASFAIVRGGHLDVTVLGGLQVSARGDLANWAVPGRGGGAIGGAMDLAAGARRVIVAMEHVTREGEPRILEACTYPLTARECVNLVVTNLAVIEVRAEELVLREVAPGISVDKVQAATGAQLLVGDHVKVMDL
jgi:3-oxoacid CoA-transferase B subunit